MTQQASTPDALIERLRSTSQGYDEWRVQDPKDGSYCISFNWREVMNPERMAREWLADHCRRFPGGLHTDFVVACVRVHSQADKLMLEAAAEIERLRADYEGACKLVADMHDDYRSASCADVARMVDKEMQYRAALVNLRAGMVDAKNTNIVDYIDAVLGAA